MGLLTAYFINRHVNISSFQVDAQKLEVDMVVSENQVISELIQQQSTVSAIESCITIAIINITDLIQ